MEKKEEKIVFHEKKFKVDILPTPISFICCSDYSRIVDYIGNRFDEDFYIMVSPIDNYKYKVNGKDKTANNVVTVLIKTENLKDYSVGTIAHESVHVVDLIYSHINEQVCVESSEMYAYMVGHITDKLYKFINKCIKKYGN